jgi:PLP dependent protein
MEVLSVSTIKANIEWVLERIAQASRSAGRVPEDIRLVVVTKTHPPEMAVAAAAAGAHYLGENYADEAVPKIKSLLGRYPVEWHMIGHIQSRKASLVCEYFDYVHSLDSLSLAVRLERLAAERDRVLPVLLECNLGGEETKYGWPVFNQGLWTEIRADLEQVVELPHLKVNGLMGMAPFFAKPEAARPHYRLLRQFQEYLRHCLPQRDWLELSMGMSGDFEVAVQEGATWVRIGQSILGPRKA